MQDQDADAVDVTEDGLADFDSLVWPHVIELDEPVTVGKGKRERTLEEIEFKEPTSGMFFDLPTNDQLLSDFFKAASSMTGQPMGVLRRLSPTDGGKVLRIVKTVLNRFLSE